MIDYKTKNLSFIQTAVDLKTLGVRNNLFFLELHDPTLQGIDPHSNPELFSPELIGRIITECIRNIWYFLREVARIPDQGSSKGIPFQLNRANLAATFCFINSLDHYLCIPRQIGKTQSTLATINWAYHFGTTFSEFMFLNMNEDAAKKNLARLKEQRDLLPVYMQSKYKYDEDGKLVKGNDNAKSLFNISTKNGIVVKGKANSVAAAETIGRGLTQPIQYFDEFEFTEYIKTIMEASGPAYSTASRNSERNKAPHCRIITTTPGDLDSPAGQDAAKIIDKTCSWSEKFYDWKLEDIKAYIENNSENGIVYIEYQYQQLGKDEEWFRAVCKTLNNERLKIQREIFLKRMHGSENSPFEPSDLAALGELEQSPIEEFFINKFFKVDVYTKLNRDQIYLVGVDVSTGVGKDNTAVTIFDPYTEKVVAEFSSSVIGITALIDFLISLVRFYLPKSILIIERNHNGEAVLDALRNSPVYGNVYFDSNKDLLVDKIDNRLDPQGFLKQEAQRRMLYGVYTSGTSRERMIGLLEEYVENHKEAFVTKNVTRDIFHLVRNRRGKIEAATGEHDDSIMSFLIILYVFHYGNNLHLFGFYKGKAPNEVDANRGLYEGLDLSEIAETDFAKELYSQANTYKTSDDFGKDMLQEIQRVREQDMDINDYFDNTSSYRVQQLNEQGAVINSEFFDYLNS